MKHLDLIGDIALQAQMLIRLGRGKEVKNKNPRVLGPKPVDTAGPLQYPGRVPGQIVIDQDTRAVQVDAFSQHVRGN